jgi:hypothetical protein
VTRIGILTITATLLLAAPALGAQITDHDAGMGWYGEADDKVITNFGFILIAFFPLFIFTMSMIQWQLDKRKDRRKAAAKARKGDDAWRGGW